MRTLRERMIKDQAFQNACKAVGIKPTVRQFSKWSRRTGLAYKQGRK